ncbi:MAG: DUF4959 domain-containing protein [Chitinophagaceae bacterium]|nr:DUF4959 domain-containing protein [Chitinophagaceae bacterium]
MKLYYILLGMSIFIFNSCVQDEIGQYPTDHIPPGEIKSPEVKNVPGGAIISYIIPDDEDLLYVKAVYTLDNGKVMEQKASAYTNRLKIEGFGRSREIDVKLIAGDRSKNESKPVIVKAHPLEAPIFSILQSVKVENDFGGILINWSNPEEADVVLDMLSTNDAGEWEVVHSFYTNAKDGKGTLRGYSNEERKFGWYLRDRWGNITDTIKGTFLPLFEEEIKGYVRWNPPGIPYNEYDYTVVLEYLWDYNPLTYHLEIARGFPWSFTFDLGKTVKLSRFHQLQRQEVSLLYTSQNVQKFEIWGSATPNVTDDFSGWTKVGSFESTKPSGGPQGVNTSADLAFAKEGEDFYVDPSVPPIRYIRYVVVDTWSGSMAWAIAELHFFGSVQ